MTADSNSRRDLKQFMGLIIVAEEKLKVCLRSNMWKKKTFQLSFNSIAGARRFLFLEYTGSNRCNICPHLYME